MCARARACGVASCAPHCLPPIPNQPHHQPQPQSKSLADAAETESLAAAAAAAAPKAAAPADGADGDAEAAAAAAAPPATPVLDACRGVMRQALLQLQALRPGGDGDDGDEDDEEEAYLALVAGDDDLDGGDETAAMAAPSAAGGGRMRRAVAAATGGLYGLLGALRGPLAPADFVGALLALGSHPSEAVRRRALALFAERVAALPAAAEDDADDAGARRARKRLAKAAMGVGALLPSLLDASKSGDVARQTALLAADAVIARFGGLRPNEALAALPPIVAAAASGPAAVRASALAALASAAAALGPKLMPQLPAVAGAALAAADAACAALGELPAADADARSGSDAEDDDATAAARAAREEQGLLLASALAALEAIVAHLGAFASPYLPRLIALALSPRALACRDGDAAGRAARLRSALPAKVPARLLVEPLVGAWDGALAGCALAAAAAGGKEGAEGGSDGEAYVEAGAAAAAPAVAHLQLAASLAAAMDHKAAAAHADALFALLLRALDTRQRQLAALADTDGGGSASARAGLAALAGGGAAAVEAAACAALVALVMKLPEAKFRPLFGRLVDWAAAASAAAAGAPDAAGATAGSAAAGGAAAARAAAGAGLGRAAALLAAVVALARRLRGVFAPYFKRGVLDLMVAQLLSPVAGGAERPKKKRKTSSKVGADGAEADADAAAAGGADDNALAAAALAGWLCRIRAMRAAHLLAAHAGPGPMDFDLFTRLLAPLARQLTSAPPAGGDGAPGAPRRRGAALAAQTADAELDGAATALALLGPAGLAAANAATGAREGDNSLAAAAAPPPAAAADAAAAAAAGALVALGLAGGSDAAWKPLNHALLIAARGAGGGARGARAKLLALGAVSRLVAALREEWLVLVPEVLPFLAELVEDGEAAVEAAAQGLLAQLEEVSGEKLDAYLRA